MVERLDCIVIGAGPAGLAAGSVLYEGGKRFVILEARDRIGGRAHSVPLSDGAKHTRTPPAATVRRTLSAPVIRVMGESLRGFAGSSLREHPGAAPAVMPRRPTAPG